MVFKKNKISRITWDFFFLSLSRFRLNKIVREDRQSYRMRGEKHEQ